MPDATLKALQNPMGDRPMDIEGPVPGHPDGTAYRERAQIAGAALAEIARVLNATPSSALYGLAVRPIDQRAATSARTSVSASATDVLILAANADRIRAVVYNDSTSDLFIGLGTAPVTATDFTLRIPTSSAYIAEGWAGQIRGRWTVATGTARVTELTP